MDLNKAMIIGNLTRDPEARSLPSGITVCKFGVATNLVWKDASGQRKEKVEFHNIVTWRKLADICSQYLTKGKKVYIEGRLQTNEWLGQDGVRRYRTEIIADNMIMLNYGASQTSGASRPAVNNFNQPNLAATRPVAGNMEGQSAAPKPISEAIPSVSLEEPAESVASAMPSEGLNENVAPAATVQAAAKQDEEIKVEDIPF